MAATVVFYGLNNAELEAPDDDAYDLVIAIAIAIQEAASNVAQWHQRSAAEERVPAPGRKCRTERSAVRQTAAMRNIDDVWPRIERHANAEFKTRTGLLFTYRVPGGFLRVTRDGREINRSLSRTNFAKALEHMPTERPSDLKDRQGSAYTWGILMDPRIRLSDW